METGVSGTASTIEVEVDSTGPARPASDLRSEATTAREDPDTAGVHQLAGARLIAYRVAEARKACARGLVLVRVHGKVPVGKEWQKQPKASEATVAAWAAVGNVGLRTGAVSGVIAIDDDTEEQSAAATLGLPTNTPTMITGSGHHNRLYKAPDFAVRNSVGTLADHVDVRGEGGMIVFPGCVHPDTGRPYLWAEGLSPDDVAFAELPAGILDRLRPIEKPSAAPSPSAGAPRSNAKDLGRRQARYAKAALQRAAERVSTAVEGTRNDTLNKEAFGLGRLVGAGWLHAEQVGPALQSAARSAGLDDAEIAKTLESGLTKGIADPADESILRESPVPTPREADARPNILMMPGQLPNVVSAAEAALLARKHEPFFERAGLPVRIVRSATATKKQGIHRPEGALTLVPLEPPYLVEAFMKAATFERIDNHGAIHVTDCPERLARHYLARRGQWRLEHLEQVIEVPILREDGSLLVTDGFDAATELYLNCNGLALPAIPEKPTIDDARSALAVLKIPIQAFPFVEASDRAAALAALLTPLVRPWLRSAPLFAFRAPKMASGKSLLADVVALLATGRVAPAMAPGRDDEEIRKRITAFLLAGFSMGCIDNIDEPFGSDVMCSILTQSVFRDRVLGKSDMVTLPTAVTWTATGNNLQFVGDITSRVVPCDLDPQVEDPETRKFDVNLYRFMPENRAELVAAGLTILRAYFVAGQPDQKLPVFGRFEDWSRSVRSPLVWLGEADACAGMARIRSVDPVREQLRLVLAYWHKHIGEGPVPASALIGLADTQREGIEAFRRAMQDVSRAEGAALDPRRLGHWLAKVERRVEGGLQCFRIGERQGTALWAVRTVTAHRVGSVGLVGDPGPVRGEGTIDGQGPVAPAELATGAPSGAAVIAAAQHRGAELPQNPHIPPGLGRRTRSGQKTARTNDAGHAGESSPA